MSKCFRNVDRMFMIVRRIWDLSCIPNPNRFYSKTQQVTFLVLFVESSSSVYT